MDLLFIEVLVWAMIVIPVALYLRKRSCGHEWRMKFVEINFRKKLISKDIFICNKCGKEKINTY
jgi:hypothetical protein